jgi:hypothetical protein
VKYFGADQLPTGAALHFVYCKSAISAKTPRTKILLTKKGKALNTVRRYIDI